VTESDAPLRVDAERNRQAILCAAAAVFSRRGTGAPLDEVAREAGVGIATLYRRFPERADLVEAVFEEKMTRYADACEAAAERSATEPWPAFVDYVHFILEEQVSDPGFSDVLIAPLGGSKSFAAHHRRALRATTALVQRIVAAGVVRDGFAHADLYLLTLANSGLIRGSRNSRMAASRRLGAYMLDAFRHPSAEPLPPVPAPWSRAERAGSIGE
jgi:AcrR family transcriptional regulator